MLPYSHSVNVNKVGCGCPRITLGLPIFYSSWVQKLYFNRCFYSLQMCACSPCKLASANGGNALKLERSDAGMAEGNGSLLLGL